MGNKTSKQVLDFERDKEYTFVGRQNAINEIKELLRNNVVVQIYGMTKIGKSRVLVQLLAEFHESRTCFYHDFNDGTDSEEDLLSLIQKFKDTLNQSFDVRKFYKEEPRDVRSAIKSLKKTIEACGTQLGAGLLLLDNVDKAFECKSVKDDILTFLKEIASLKGSSLQVIFTTSEKIGLVIQQFGEVEIGPIEDEHIYEILKTIITKKGVTADGFDYAHAILGEQNEVYIGIIVKQCEGLPLAAYMVAHELVADEGMRDPSEMVQLLFNKRVESLSLEYYPPDDRLDFYKRNIEKVLVNIGIYFFQTLNRNLDTSNRQSIDRLKTEFTKDKDKTKVDITTCFKLLTQPCIMKFLGKTRQLDMHVIFRECIFNMTGSDRLDDDVFRSLLYESAKRYGLMLSETELDNPQLLEEYILRLAERENANGNDNLLAREQSELDEHSWCDTEDQRETKEVTYYHTPFLTNELLPQTDEPSVTNNVCDTCKRPKSTSKKKSDIDLLTDRVQSHLKIDPNNLDVCTCNQKLKDLKCVGSIEDNASYSESESTSVPTTHEHLIGAPGESRMTESEPRGLTGNEPMGSSSESDGHTMPFAIHCQPISTDVCQNDLSTEIDRRDMANSLSNNRKVSIENNEDQTTDEDYR